MCDFLDWINWNRVYEWNPRIHCHFRALYHIYSCPWTKIPHFPYKTHYDNSKNCIFWNIFDCANRLNPFRSISFSFPVFISFLCANFAHWPKITPILCLNLSFYSISLQTNFKLILCVSSKCDWKKNYWTNRCNFLNSSRNSMSKCRMSKK